jgi:hypothetical protein
MRIIERSPLVIGAASNSRTTPPFSGYSESREMAADGGRITIP